MSPPQDKLVSEALIKPVYQGGKPWRPSIIGDVVVGVLDARGRNNVLSFNLLRYIVEKVAHKNSFTKTHSTGHKDTWHEGGIEMFTWGKLDNTGKFMPRHKPAKEVAVYKFNRMWWDKHMKHRDAIAGGVNDDE